MPIVHVVIIIIDPLCGCTYMILQRLIRHESLMDVRVWGVPVAVYQADRMRQESCCRDTAHPTTARCREPNDADESLDRIALSQHDRRTSRLLDQTVRQYRHRCASKHGYF